MCIPKFIQGGNGNHKLVSLLPGLVCHTPNVCHDVYNRKRDIEGKFNVLSYVYICVVPLLTI